MKQSKSKVISLLTHVPGIGHYTGTKIVLSGTRCASYVTETDTKARIADLKIKQLAT